MPSKPQPPTKSKPKKVAKRGKGTALVTVRVTDDCICRGVPKSPRDCPVAHAMRNAGFINPGVRFNGTSAFHDGCGVVILPAKVRGFVEKFDSGNLAGLRPFSFRLRKAMPVPKPGRKGRVKK